MTISCSLFCIAVQRNILQVRIHVNVIEHDICMPQLALRIAWGLIPATSNLGGSIESQSFHRGPDHYLSVDLAVALAFRPQTYSMICLLVASNIQTMLKIRNFVCSI